MAPTTPDARAAPAEPDLPLSSCVLCGHELPDDPVVADLRGMAFALHPRCAKHGLESAGLGSDHGRDGAARTDGSARPAGSDGATAPADGTVERTDDPVVEGGRGAAPETPDDGATNSPGSAGGTRARTTRLDEFT